jgi:peptidoglycan L-alanyl-D-glutamate endopeptidase CwlK
MSVNNSLNYLFPPFADQIVKSNNYLKAYNFVVYETYRSFEEQLNRYSQGRSLINGVWITVSPKLVVTNAKPGFGLHAYGLAVDHVTDGDMKKTGIQWNWKDTYVDIFGQTQKVQWKQIGTIDKKLGLEWAGNWKTFPEYPHSQNTYGFTVSKLYQVLTSEGLESVWKMIRWKIKPSVSIVPVPINISQPPKIISVVSAEDLDQTKPQVSILKKILR